MSRARSAVAARTTVDKLRAAALAAFELKVQPDTEETFDDFFDVSQACRPLTELLGGEAGVNGWYFWAEGDWALLGDLGMTLVKEPEALERLSELLGTEVIVAAVDLSFEFAHFAAYEGGRVRRRLELADGEFLVEGLPVKAERGRQTLDFSEEEAERLWTSYKLPTFDFDPQDGPFTVVGVSAEAD